MFIITKGRGGLLLRGGYYKIREQRVSCRIQNRSEPRRREAAEAPRAEVLALVDIFKGEIVDVTSESMIIQATGTTAELENLEELLRGNGLVEMVRTGVVALGRGGKTT